MVTHTDCTRDDEVHFKYLFFFVENHIFFFFFTEMAGFEAKSNIVKEFAIFVLLGVEEKAEIVENVIK